MFINVLLCFFLVVKGQLRWVGVWWWVFSFFLYIRMFTNILIHFFLIGNSQELGIEVGRCFGGGFWFYLYIRTFTNVLLCFFLVGKGQLRWVGDWEQVFNFFLYIRTFTNVLLQFVLVGNGQEVRIEVGRYFRWCFIFFYI